MKHHRFTLMVVTLTIIGLTTFQVYLASQAAQQPAQVAAQSASTDAPEPEPPPEPVSEPKPVERLLGQFSTQFKAGPKYEGRVTNITLLAEKLSGLVLQPGQEFSFNQTVGPRTLEAGFKDAPTYFLGEVLPGVGGGTCQVSSTLFAVAVHTNIEVIDRRPHSRKSSYIAAGLDAAVNYPKECWDAAKPDKRVCYDLKLKNPYDFPLTFRFETSDEIVEGKRTLTAKVFGAGEVPKVTTKWRPHGSAPFDVRYRRVSYWEDDRKKLSQSGQPGLRGARELTIEWPDGRTETSKIYSEYQPVPEVWKVGMGFEKSETE